MVELTLFREFIEFTNYKFNTLNSQVSPQKVMFQFVYKSPNTFLIDVLFNYNKNDLNYKLEKNTKTIKTIV